MRHDIVSGFWGLTKNRTGALPLHPAKETQTSPRGLRHLLLSPLAKCLATPMKA